MEENCLMQTIPKISFVNLFFEKIPIYIGTALKKLFVYQLPLGCTSPTLRSEELCKF